MISKGLLPILFSILTILLAGCRSLDTSTADAQLDRGEYYDAQRNYRKVYNRLTKRNQRARRGEIARKLAICHTRLNQPARAALMLRNAIRYGQDDPQITLMLGQSLQREGKYAEAMKFTRNILPAMGSMQKPQPVSKAASWRSAKRTAHDIV